MKLECHKTQEALAAYVDGERASLQSAEVQAHLESCEDCKILYGEIQHALFASGFDESSTALSRDGGQPRLLPQPDAQYWSDLPGRVMERINASARPARIANDESQFVKKPAPKNVRRLQFAKFFTEPKMRPVLALAAVIFLVFLVTRSLQLSSISPNRSEVLSDESLTSPESSAPAAKENIIAPQQSAPAAPQKTLISDSAEFAAMAQAPVQQPVEQVAKTDAPANKAEDVVSLQPAETVLAEDVAVEKSLTTAAEVSGAASQRTVSAPLRAKKSRVTASEAAPRVYQSAAPENSFALALWRAQQAHTPMQQQKIWQDFLANATDSSYVNLGILHLAQSLAAQADSSSSGDQLRSTLHFFEHHEPILRPLLGTEKFGAEMQRLQSLQKKEKR